MQKMDLNNETQSTLFSTGKKQEPFSANRSLKEMKYNVLFSKPTKKEETSNDKNSFANYFQRTTTPNIDFKEKLRRLENSFTYSKPTNKLSGKEKSNAYINLFTEESMKSNQNKSNEYKRLSEYKSFSKTQDRFGLENVVYNNNKKNSFSIINLEKNSNTNSTATLNTISVLRKNENTRSNSTGINFKLNERKNEIKHLLQKKENNLSPSLMLRGSINKSKTSGKTFLSHYDEFLNKKKNYSSNIKVNSLKKRFDKFF